VHLSISWQNAAGPLLENIKLQKTYGIMDKQDDHTIGVFSGYDLAPFLSVKLCPDRSPQAAADQLEQGA